ncbi:MAG: tetratricopeptide repeat protein [Candidatus Melainabacteria bacterium]|jgi:tetratricopeptide (TPR) repeat protein|nr:tetratricopeptide repeat protein [Candidatus Melainabacteria bacterium]
MGNNDISPPGPEPGSTTGVRAKFRAARQKVQAFQDKIRPYQKTINKIRIVLYAIAIPWAVFIAVKSLPYYAAIGKGESYFKQGLYDEAEKEFLYCYEQCKAESASDPRLARVLNNLGVLYRGTGRYRLAEPYIKETVEIVEKHSKKREELPVSLSNQGALYSDEGRYADAETVYRRAIQVWKDKVKKESDTKLAMIYNGMTRALREQGKLEESMQAGKTALQMMEKESGKDSLNSAPILENVGKTSQRMGDFKAAEKYFTDALAIDRKAHGAKHPDVASDECSMGRLLTEEGKLKEARAFLESSLSTRKSFFLSGHPTISKTVSSLGQLAIKEGDRDKAVSLLAQALKAQSKILGEQHPDTLETANALKLAESMQAMKMSKTLQSKTEK